MVFIPCQAPPQERHTADQWILTRYILQFMQYCSELILSNSEESIESVDNQMVYHDPVYGDHPFRCIRTLKIAAMQKVDYSLCTRRRIIRWKLESFQVVFGFFVFICAVAILAVFLATGNYSTWQDSILSVGTSFVVCILIVAFVLMLLFAYRVFSIIESQTVRLEEIEDSDKAVEQATKVFNDIYEPLSIFINRVTPAFNIIMGMIALLMFVTVCSVFSTNSKLNDNVNGKVLQLFGVVLLFGLILQRVAKVNDRYESFLNRFFAFRGPQHSKVVAAFTYFSNNPIQVS
jgi:ABC-type dipeptide/oligopeptide/nickel transport system permease component